MRTNITKISTKIWEPLMGSLGGKLDRACLKRDAYLDRVLEIELPELVTDVPVPNSNAARDFVANRLDALPRKLVTFSLRTDLVKRLDSIFEEKQIVRDAFFNRLLLLLALPKDGIDRLFFADHPDWAQAVWVGYRNDGPAYNNLFYPLEPEINPFWAIRIGLELNNTNNEHDEGDSSGGIYTKVLDGQLIKGTDLVGLNCSLPDMYIPGHPEQVKHRPKTLDELLAHAHDDL